MDEKTERVKTRVTIANPSKREMEIEVAADDVAKEWERVLEEYTSRARLDGFRRGKAPKEMVKRLFYADIKDGVVESLVPRALRESLRAENLHPITTPVIRDLVFKEGEPFFFKATVEILPDFELPPYKKVKIKKREAKVEDAEVDKSLEDLRQKSAVYVPVQGRGVVDGDYVVLEWKGKDLKTKRFLPTEKVLILAGHPENEKTLNENLLGLGSQETRRFSISYPQGHPRKKLAGRSLEYEIKVISIKEKKIPEKTDDWAKDLGEFENLADLRIKVRKELEKSKDNSARRDMADEIVEHIAKGLNVHLPESLVEQETSSLLREWMAAANETLTVEQLEELRLKAKVRAEETLKTSLILRKIAAQEGLEVSDEEVEEEIKAMAKRSNIPLAEIVDKLNKEGKREDLRTDLLLRKAIDFLLENAVVY